MPHINVRFRYIFRLVLALCFMLLGRGHAQGLEPVAPDQWRVATWNIELLGSRMPPRTPAQLDDLAARLLSLDAAVIAVQEMSLESFDPRNRPTLDGVVGAMGSNWRYLIGEGTNGVLYDSGQVEVLSSQELSVLRVPPYSSFYEDFPDWRNEFGNNGAPFFDGRADSFTADFEFLSTGQRLRVISCHFHAGAQFGFLRAYEGAALSAYVAELKADPDQSQDILLLGDFNAQAGQDPHPQLQTELVPVPKSNSLNTTVVSTNEVELDHIYASATALARIPGASAFVVRPEHFGIDATTFDAALSDHVPVLVDLQSIDTALYSGAWYDPSHTGEGWLIEVLPGEVVQIFWFTYSETGAQMWLLGLGRVAGNSIVIDELFVTSGPSFGPDFEPDAVEPVLWGSLTMTFEGCNTASLQYESVLGFGSGTLNPIRLTSLLDQHCDD